MDLSTSCFVFPQPHFEHVPINMQGYSWWKQITYTWKTPPTFKITDDWHVVIYEGMKIVVPSQFITDFASTPRILWPLIEPDGPLYMGAILHDFGYQHGYLLSEYDRMTVYDAKSIDFRNTHLATFGPFIPVHIGKPQSFFDTLLHDVTVFTSGGTIQADEAYYALKEFGGITWNKYRKLGPGAFGINSLGLPGIIQ